MVGQNSSDNNNSTIIRPATIADITGTRFRSPNLTQHETNTSNKTSRMPLPPSHSPESQQAPHPLNDRVKEDAQASVHFDKVVETTSKLEELKSLLNKHYPPKYARHFFVCISYLFNQGMDDVLDERLRFVREMK